MKHSKPPCEPPGRLPPSALPPGQRPRQPVHTLYPPLPPCRRVSGPSGPSTHSGLHLRPAAGSAAPPARPPFSDHHLRPFTQGQRHGFGVGSWVYLTNDGLGSGRGSCIELKHTRVLLFSPRSFHSTPAQVTFYPTRFKTVPCFRAIQGDAKRQTSPRVRPLRSVGLNHTGFLLVP